MNLDHFKPLPLPRFGGAVDYQDPTKVIPGCARLAQDVRFTPDMVGTRFGTVDTMKRAEPSTDVTGIDVLDVLGLLNPGEVPVVFTDDGTLLQEIPAGTGAMVKLTPPFNLPTGARMQTTNAENSMFMAFGDGSRGLCAPLVLNGRTKNLSRVACNVIGAPWNRYTIYQPGDVVRIPDGRWFLCTVGNSSGAATATGPVWPPTYAGGLSPEPDPVWLPITVQDAIAGGSFWIEWTPACESFLPPPVVSAPGLNVVVNNSPGGGTIPAGKDIYIKLTYVVTGPNPGESPRSGALKFTNTGVNDKLTVVYSGAGTSPGPPMPRWMGEINLRPDLFYPFALNIYVAAVTTGNPEPADSAYGLYAFELDPGATISISNGSALPAIVANIISASASGAIIGFTVDDVTGFAVGEGVQAAGVSTGLFNATWVISRLFLAPTNVVWCTRVAGSPASGTGGTLTGLGAGGPAYPQGAAIRLKISASAQQFIGQSGQRWMIVVRKDKNGSLAAVDPDSPIQVSMIGAFQSDIVGPGNITRNSSGDITANVADISKFSVGKQVEITGVDDTTFDGKYNVDLLGPSDTNPAPAGFLTFLATANHTPASSQNGLVKAIPGPPPVAFLPPGGTNDLQDIAAFTVTGASKGGPYFYISEAIPPRALVSFILDFTIADGSFIATLADPTGFDPGDTIYVSVGNPVDAVGIAVIASASGSKVTWATDSIADGDYFGGTVILQPNLPTTAFAGTRTIVSLKSDGLGNVVAVLNDVGGMAAGHMMVVAGTGVGSLNHLVQIESVRSDNTGIGGTVTWTDSTSLNATVAIGTVAASPNIAINYQDELLELEADNEVTDQLSMMPPPNAVDVYFVPSLRKFVYVDGLSSIFYFSNTDDPANIDGEAGGLSVDDNSMSLAIAVREIPNVGVFALKEDGGYQITPSDLPPTEWSCPPRWKLDGPPCAAAVGVGKEMIVFPSFRGQAGAYRYAGEGLQWISQEFQKAWDRVNRAALNTCWTLVDETEHEVLFGVPLDDATTPSHILVCSYVAGWGEPEVLNRQGQLFASRDARRWSIRKLATRTATIAKRTLQAPQVSLGTAFTFTSIARVGGVVTATYVAPPAIPPASIPGGQLSVSSPGDHSFDGVFPIIKSPSLTTLVWIQGLIGDSLVLATWGWTGGLAGNAPVTLTIAGVIPAGVMAGKRLYLRFTGTGLDETSEVIETITQNAGSYTITYHHAAVLAFDVQNGVNGICFLFTAAANASTLVDGTTSLASFVPAPPADERIAKRQVLLGVSDADPLNVYAIRSLQRVLGVVTAVVLVPSGQLVGSTLPVLVEDSGEGGFSGEFNATGVATVNDGTASIQWDQDGPDETLYGGTLATTLPCARVVMQDPTRRNDNGRGIDSRYETALARGGGLVIMRWGGYRAQIAGEGNVYITPTSDDEDAEFSDHPFELEAGKARRLEAGVRIPDNEYMGVLVTNGGRADSFFELHEFILYGIPLLPGRRR